MAKGGYNRRRIQQKKQRERIARKRAARRRRWMQIVVAVIVLVLLGGVSLIAVTAGDEGSLADDPTPAPTPTVCTTPGPSTAGKKQFPNPPCMSIDTTKTYTATFVTTKGTIVVDLFAEQAPITVNNFVFLARQKYYDGSVFHRVIAGFGGAGSDMVQGGDPVNNDGTGGPGYSFGDENTIPFDKAGYLAMANAGPGPDGKGTNGSQFFFLSGTVQHLNVPGTCPAPAGQQASCHSVFGAVTSGLDVIKAIAAAPKTGERPTEDIRITTLSITER